jgi:hypothetical protein
MLAAPLLRRVRHALRVIGLPVLAGPARRWGPGDGGGATAGLLYGCCGAAVVPSAMLKRCAEPVGVEAQAVGMLLPLVRGALPDAGDPAV